MTFRSKKALTELSEQRQEKYRQQFNKMTPQEPVKESVLTVEDIFSIEEGTIIGTGLLTDPRIYKDQVRWVAAVGEVDWAIYYHHAFHDKNYIKRSGDKMFTPEVIRALVPCTDEAFKLYRR